MDKESTRLNGKDLINVGIFTAIISVMMILISFIGFIPYLMPTYCIFMPLLIGIPWMLFATKVNKFGMVLIMGILLGIVLMLTGMGWYAMPLCIVVSLIAEFIMKSGDYKSAKKDIFAYGVFSLWVFGSYIPIFLTAEQYWADRGSYGEEYIATAMSIFQPWLAPIMIVACFVFGVIGAWIGLKVMKKHFVKAGIV